MKMMKNFMETLLLNVKESFERSFSALQAELFEIRRVFERETFHRQQLEEEVKELKDGMEKLNREIVLVRERERRRRRTGEEEPGHCYRQRPIRQSE